MRTIFASITIVSALLAGSAYADTEQRLRIAMTTPDLPTTTGMPTNGTEGMRFAGYPVFEPLVAWDLRSADQRAKIIPGLATSWEVDPNDHAKWTFKLRQGVKFHDGTDFNADAVIWNLERFWSESAPQFDKATSAPVKSRAPLLSGWSKVDDYTIVLETSEPTSFFPASMTQVLMVSPAQFAKVGSDWAAFGSDPAGTGPFRISAVNPRQSIRMVRNDDYWDKDRLPKLETVELYPMAESSTRLAALQSGQVDWIEVPPPDAIPMLRQQGYQITLKEYPHVWPYIFSVVDGSPFKDVKVRQAANYAINREGIVQLLNGTVRPAISFVPADDVSYGKPSITYGYDPEKAKALLAEAGYGAQNPLPVKIMISTSGGGQLLPLPMNELIQRDLEAVGFKVEFDVVEWGQMVTGFRQAPDSAINNGRHAMNISLTFTDPTAWYRWFASASATPNGNNWGHWSNPAFDAALDAVAKNFDPAAMDGLLAKANEVLTEDPPLLFVVHDLNPRAMSAKVKGYVPAQTWYLDLTSIYME